ncbi:MAG: response regulator [Prochloraceae cyanobacterium]|nr:response regulator [Prochloraceae cyanobacterium]
MIVITEKELAAQNKQERAKSEVVQYNNKVLVSGPVFAKTLRHKAIKLCQEYSQKNIFCLLVENDWSLTVWIERYKTESTSSVAKKQPPSLDKLVKDKPKIACIDDSKAVQRQVKKTLEWAGYEVVPILEPVSSITLLARHQPKLILMDIEMPHFDGYELCQMLQKSRKLKLVPIVMLTGRDGIVDRIRAKLSGAVGFLNKPVSPRELIDFVAKLVPISEENP